MTSKLPVVMPFSEHAFQRLQALGAGEFAHVNGSLALHLRGTETLLRSWGNREALCLAGLYHAVYGTDGIAGSLASISMRGPIADAIGDEAESVAYLYGACAREVFHPRIGTSDQLAFADRFTRSEYPLTESQLRDFCEITLANELDLALGSERFRAKYGAELARFFERMRGLVSEAGFDAVRKALGHATAPSMEAADPYVRAPSGTATIGGTFGENRDENRPHRSCCHDGQGYRRDL